MTRDADAIGRPCTSRGGLFRSSCVRPRRPRGRRRVAGFEAKNRSKRGSLDRRDETTRGRTPQSLLVNTPTTLSSTSLDVHASVPLGDRSRGLRQGRSGCWRGARHAEERAVGQTRTINRCNVCERIQPLESFRRPLIRLYYIKYLHRDLHTNPQVKNPGPLPPKVSLCIGLAPGPYLPHIRKPHSDLTVRLDPYIYLILFTEGEGELVFLGDMDRAVVFPGMDRPRCRD